MTDTGLRMKVGVLIPTYNRAVYLKEALRSVTSQNYTNLEIIVIDNGSSDGTGRLMAGIADSRVRYLVNEQNLGLLGSINKGIRLFSPEVVWCTILPDDDLLADGFIAAMVATQEESGAKAVIHGKRLLIDGAGDVIREALPAPSYESAFDYLKSRAKRKRETFLTGVFFSRKAFELIGGYPQFATGMATDDAFIFALSLQDRLVYAENAVACIRMHEGAESHDSQSSRHLVALIDFRHYLIQAVANHIEAGYGTDERLTFSLPKLLKKYICSLASSFWLRDAKNLVKHPGNTTDLRIKELCDTVTGLEQAFSLRVRTSAATMRRFGFFPERCLGYRAFWEISGKIARSFGREL